MSGVEIVVTVFHRVLSMFARVHLGKLCVHCIERSITNYQMAHLAVLCDSLRYGAYGIICYGGSWNGMYILMQGTVNVLLVVFRSYCLCRSSIRKRNVLEFEGAHAKAARCFSRVGC